jgi:hypothetical protein
MGLPTVSPELEEGVDWEVCQLILRTADGFYEDIDIIYWDLEDSSGPDPPINSFNESNIDPLMIDPTAGALTLAQFVNSTLTVY